MKNKLLLCICMMLGLTGCGSKKEISETPTPSPTPEVTAEVATKSLQEAIKETTPEFNTLDDEALLTYVKDSMYEELVQELGPEYYVENIETSYVSKEYLENLEYNSQSNIYFGYTQDDLDAQFNGTKYVFTLGDNNQTVVQPFEAFGDAYAKALKNVAIGSGVILVCVTVSAVTAGSAPAVSVIFAASAKTGAVFATKYAALSGITTAVVTGIQTKDFDETLEKASLAASEGFKFGAISGALGGGLEKATGLYGATTNGLTMNEVAKIERESKYPLDVIKGFKTMDQYEICKEAGLKPVMVNGKMELIRKIDLTKVDEYGRTNLERMKAGLAAIDSDGVSYQIHHIGQKINSTLAILTKAEHMQNGNDLIWHDKDIESQVHNEGNTWNTERAQFWKTVATLLESGGVE